MVLGVQRYVLSDKNQCFGHLWSGVTDLNDIDSATHLTLSPVSLVSFEFLSVDHILATNNFRG